MTYLSQLDTNQQELIMRHLELVLQANESTNLTRIDTFEEGKLLHVEDSLVALPEICDAPAGWYGDLGSGGGFPGIPVAIATGRKTLLVDARQKKMEIVSRIVEELGLSDAIETYAGRAELLARKRPSSFSVLTARALAKLPVLLELASPLLARGGRIVCYKANIDEKELRDGERVAALVGMRTVSNRSVLLDDEYTRHIVVFEKVSRSRVHLPRQEGAAQRSPL